MTVETINTLTKAWREVITPDDYEDHMEIVEQAQPLAEGWIQMIEQFPPEQPGLLWIAGGGTAQFLNYVNSDNLRQLADSGTSFVITDISSSFLDKASKRITEKGLRNYFTVQRHDLMQDEPIEEATAASLSLVLEHLEDWRQGLSNLTNPGSIDTLYVQIQTYADEFTTQGIVTKSVELRPSIQKFVNLIDQGVISPKDIDPGELIDHMGNLGFENVFQIETPVPNSKAMTGFVFKRKGAVIPNE